MYLRWVDYDPEEHLRVLEEYQKIEMVKIYGEVFFQNRKLKIFKNTYLSYNFSSLFTYFPTWYSKLNIKFLKAFDRKNFKIFKKNCDNSTILQMPRYQSNGKYWAILLVSFTFAPYETRTQRAVASRE